ncbi:MAG: AAA family ATPase [bacterium]|nr:AAA family ATPase [bacterium]
MTRENQKAIFEFLSEQNDAFIAIDQDDDDGYIPFISMIWDIDNMPSTDIRYKSESMRDDIIRHTIHAPDWDLEELFINKLKLYEDESKFLRFVELSLAPKFCQYAKDSEFRMGAINPYLEGDGLTLQPKREVDSELDPYNYDSRTIYKIIDFDLIQHLPNGVELNTIPIHVNSPGSGAQYSNTVAVPEKLPALVLNHWDRWNDSGWLTIFYLFYCTDDGIENIGKIKIMESDSHNIMTVIPNSFFELNDSYCSLGQSDDFYYDLRDRFPDEYLNILYALRDAAFFPKIHEDFEKNSGFNNSLLRSSQAGRVLRLIRHKIEGRDIDNLYDFHYEYKPPYSRQPVDIHFGFKTPQNSTDRIFALIGENGVGKTQLMSQLPISIAEGKSQFFSPQIPLFSKIIAVSYSAFDEFKIPKKNVHFNYHHCGLRKEDGKPYTKRGLTMRFNKSCLRISYLERMQTWRRILSNFIENSILDLFILPWNRNMTEELYPGQFLSRKNGFVYHNDGFSEARQKMSSGQNILLYIITEIVANIRFDSLILYDEPETHLHPNAISRLVNAIYELVQDFESYCLIATHSPMVIRELSSKNVFVMERNERNLSVRRIGIESFGENISVLTDVVFGNGSITKQFSTIINELIESGKSYDEIVEEFDSGRPLSLNTRLHIQSLLNQNNA